MPKRRFEGMPRAIAAALAKRIVKTTNPALGRVHQLRTAGIQPSSIALLRTAPLSALVASRA